MSRDPRSSHTDTRSTPADARSAGSDADDPLRALADPETLRDRPDVPFDVTPRPREDRDHCGTETAGQAIAGVENDAGELLLLVNREEGIALLPHGSVGQEDDWIAAARDGVRGQTGIAVEVDGIETVRRVEHVLEDEDESHATTHHVVFRGTATGGEIRECKRSADAGSDPWTAGWYDGLPDGVELPEGTPGDDLRLFLE